MYTSKFCDEFSFNMQIIIITIIIIIIIGICFNMPIITMLLAVLLL